MCSVSPLDIANHAKLLRRIPHTNRSIFIATMRKLLANYTKASMDQDPTDLHNCLVEILMLPGQTMISRRGGKKGRQRDSAIMHHRLMDRNFSLFTLTLAPTSVKISIAHSHFICNLFVKRQPYICSSHCQLPFSYLICP